MEQLGKKEMVGYLERDIVIGMVFNVVKVKEAMAMVLFVPSI